MTQPARRPGLRLRPVPAQVDLPALEREVLEFWHDRDTFAKNLARNAGGPAWTFYEGPPTANGPPGTHHVEARVFKDVFPRYRTMKGYLVDRRAGWDCHGLPVEIAVEKELGFAGKGDIEAYGIAAFNERCRESVERHVGEFEAMTRRMGYWVDMSRAYWTMDPAYVQSVWWSLKTIFDKGLLVEDHRVAPYCPRCGTGLSDHELAQGYETVVDPSIYVRLPVTSGVLRERYGSGGDGAAAGLALLVWTTTPWTLVANTAVAVHPDVTYVVARAAGSTELLVVAEPLLTAVLGEDAEVLGRHLGRELEHTPYQRPFALLPWPAGAQGHFVALADYVSTEDGTGLVHQAPAFGADDLAVGRAYGLPVLNPVRPDGTFDATLPLVGGQFFKTADKALVEDLAERGLLFLDQAYEHAYPHCWRCHTALLYYAQPSWYIRTTAVKDALLRENKATDWHPRNVQWGRYGDWLRNNIDWALSRNRYWGTPLPIWRNEVDPGHLVCVGSLTELGELAGTDLSALDPHRPYVDDVTFTLPGVPGTFRRVPEVIDAWYDSGSMPFAQWGYPHAPGSAEAFTAAYPADFICEAIDQTRGWFYTLMAVGTLVHDRSAYRTVLCLGHILAEDGRKMSKHLGNILEPLPLMNRHGADALRWFMAASGSPWLARRVGHAALQDVVRKTLLTYWNTVSFHTLYAAAAGWSPEPEPQAPGDRPAHPLDQWALSEAHRLVRDVDAAYEAFDTPRAGQRISAFIDDLSNWYVRRSRRRFWAGDPAAHATLHTCLDLLTRVMAPLVPFITERVWQDVIRPVDPAAPESVHLSDWPAHDPAVIDEQLAEQMALTRRLVELGRAARAQSEVRTRQPLSRALVAATGWEQLPDQLRTQVREELNVEDFAALGEAGGELVEVSAKGNFRSLGRRFGKSTPAVAAAIAAADAAVLARALRSAGTARVVVDGAEVALSTDEVLLTETPRQGWVVASEHGETVALDLTLTPELRRAGTAREVVRLVQDARKTAALEITDRIDLWWTATDVEVARAVREHQTGIAAEVLAVTVHEGEPDAAATSRFDPAMGLVFWLRPAKPAALMPESSKA
jgi:isoleucyl-tRNA synthetase